MKCQFFPSESWTVPPRSQEKQIGHRANFLIHRIFRPLNHRKNVLLINEKLSNCPQQQFQIVRMIRRSFPIDLHPVEIVRLEKVHDGFGKFFAVESAVAFGQFGEQFSSIWNRDRDEHLQRWIPRSMSRYRFISTYI